MPLDLHMYVSTYVYICISVCTHANVSQNFTSVSSHLPIESIYIFSLHTCMFIYVPVYVHIPAQIELSRAPKEKLVEADAR